MTTHRHLDSRKLWTSTVTDPDLSQFATTGALAALVARVTKLEGAVVPPPPPPPPALPLAPTNLRAVPGNGYVDLSWT